MTQENLLLIPVILFTVSITYWMVNVCLFIMFEDNENCIGKYVRSDIHFKIMGSLFLLSIASIIITVALSLF